MTDLALSYCQSLVAAQTSEVWPNLGSLFQSLQRRSLGQANDQEKGKTLTKITGIKSVPGADHVRSPGAMEEAMADISRLISEQEFESEGEMNDFLDSMLASAASPTSKPHTPLEEAQT